jgi:hypothetical protein
MGLKCALADAEELLKGTLALLTLSDLRGMQISSKDWLSTMPK